MGMLHQVINAGRMFCVTCNVCQPRPTTIVLVRTTQEEQFPEPESSHDILEDQVKEMQVESFLRKSPRPKQKRNRKQHYVGLGRERLWG